MQPKLVELPADLNTTTSTGECDYEIKVIVAGDINAGKSSLIVRFIDNIFREDTYLVSSTLNIDCKFKCLKLLVDSTEKTVKLNVWDTVGQERYKALTQSYYRGANAVILAIDLTDPKAFQKLEGWIGEIQKQTNSMTRIVLVGTKADLVDKRMISAGDMRDAAFHKGLEYIETSAKSGEGIIKAFSLAAKNAVQVIVRQKESVEVRNKQTFPKTSEQNVQGCCTIS